MHQYLVYITMGGLMEDPGFHDEHHRTILAKDEDEAVKKWAKMTGFDDPQYLERRGKGRWTFWGWTVHVRKLS